MFRSCIHFTQAQFLLLLLSFTAGHRGRLDHVGRLLGAKVYLRPDDYEQPRRRPARDHLHREPEGVQLRAVRHHQLCLTVSAAAAGHDRKLATVAF